MTKQALRPPSVPLITVDPYFNIWSAADRLTDAETVHWTGKMHSMVGIVRIDGNAYRFMGGHTRTSDVRHVPAPAMTQTELKVTPLSSVYTFEAGGVRLTVRFTTPLLLDDLEVLSRPASYVQFRAEAIDGGVHQLELYYDIGGELAVDSPIQEVAADRSLLPDGSPVLRIGTTTQKLLNRSGDDLRIDWGYACLIVPGGEPEDMAIADRLAREQFAAEGSFPSGDDTDLPSDLISRKPVLASRIRFGEVNGAGTERRLIVAYDDIMSVEYFQAPLPGYWKRNGQTFEEMLTAAIAEAGELLDRCDRFDAQLLTEAASAGGEKYADLCALAYRQAIAAHKLVADEQGEVLFFSKENFSNGCMGTVDVSYPSIPLFLKYAPELVKGMLRPVFRYAASEAWPYDFAPHDVGRYPLANGQAYGMTMEKQMPIEECGNMLIMTATVCKADGHAGFAEAHWEMLRKWAQYLTDFGMDPGNQLCTDDFGGHLAHNANLSIKAIIGIGCYGLLARMRGDEATAARMLETAREMAGLWETKARNGDYYRLAFDTPDSWSLKYNLVWDTLLGLNLFDPAIRAREVRHYLSVQNKYGVPLDNRQTYTKADWLVWAAILAERQEDFEALIEPLWLFLHETRSRVPFTDWYYTIDGRLTGFINRSVVGGIFIKLLDTATTGAASAEDELHRVAP